MCQFFGRCNSFSFSFHSVFAYANETLFYRVHCHWINARMRPQHYVNERNLIASVDFDETYHIAYIFCAMQLSVCVVRNACLSSPAIGTFVIRHQYIVRGENCIENEGFRIIDEFYYIFGFLLQKRKKHKHGQLAIFHRLSSHWRA